jgi:hypothetical protein
VEALCSAGQTFEGYELKGILSLPQDIFVVAREQLTRIGVRLTILNTAPGSHGDLAQNSGKRRFDP